jgi:hypothetical protein
MAFSASGFTKVKETPDLSFVILITFGLARKSPWSGQFVLFWPEALSRRANLKEPSFNKRTWNGEGNVTRRNHSNASAGAERETQRGISR